MLDTHLEVRDGKHEPVKNIADFLPTHTFHIMPNVEERSRSNAHSILEKKKETEQLMVERLLSSIRSEDTDMQAEVAWPQNVII